MIKGVFNAVLAALAPPQGERVPYTYWMKSKPPKKPKNNPAGTKLRRKCAAKTLTQRHY